MSELHIFLWTKGRHTNLKLSLPATTKAHWSERGKFTNKKKNRSQIFSTFRCLEPTKVNWKSSWWIQYFSRPCSTTVGQLVGTIVCSKAAQLTSLTPFWIVIIYCILCMCYVVYYIGQEMSINLSNYNSTNLRSTFVHSGMPFILKRTFQFSPFFWQIDFPPPSEVPPPLFQFYRKYVYKFIFDSCFYLKISEIKRKSLE